jgi:hypothetical protein
VILLNTFFEERDLGLNKSLEIFLSNYQPLGLMAQNNAPLVFGELLKPVYLTNSAFFNPA